MIPVVVAPVEVSDTPTVGNPTQVADTTTVGVVTADEQIAVGKPTKLTGGLNGAALWSGEGPPSPDNPVLGARPGDEYLDELTGNLYRLDVG